MKKLLTLLVALILTLSCAAFAESDSKTIVIGATPSPHAEVLELIKDDMAALLAETESSDPQIIADKLFGKAMINYDEKPKDDITVIVARIKQ